MEINEDGQRPEIPDFTFLIPVQNKRAVTSVTIIWQSIRSRPFRSVLSRSAPVKTNTCFSEHHY